MPNYTTYNIQMVKGDTESFGFEVEGVDSLDAAYFSCKQNSQDTEYLFQKSLDYGITQDENNRFSVRIAPSDTQNLEPGQYWYDLEIQKNGDVFTIFRGVLDILPQITRDVLPRSDATWGFITGEINNQTDLQLELDTKADTSSLSAVATSGSYEDLTNTPNLATVATSGSYTDLSNTPNLATVATSGSYTDLSNTPAIPTKTSELTNDSSFVVSTNLATVATSGSYTDLSNTPSLATVATSGSYTDLTNKPSIPTKTSDLTNDSNFVVSTNLATVATSGSYTDLSNTPTIPTTSSIVDLIYPVGSYYWSSQSTDPGTLFGIGTWTQITNKFVFAAGGSYASGDTGGEAMHQLTISEMPKHTHTTTGPYGIEVNYPGGGTTTNYASPTQSGLTIDLEYILTGSKGSNGSHNNMPPYIVAYCWRRDA